MEKISEVGVKITLSKPDDFLLCKETLTRIGVANIKTKTLYQSAHILHKRGEYYICHFKEMFILDGKPSTITEEDLTRRNLIVKLLHDWGLIEADVSSLEIAPLSAIKIVPFKQKASWSLVPKYTIGVKHYDISKVKGE